MIEGRRINNTRARNAASDKPKEPREPRVRTVVAFSLYEPHPDESGGLFWHMAPMDYLCKALTVYVGGVNGETVRLRFSVNDTEYIERDMKVGENEFEVNRVIPAGSRVSISVVEGSGLNFWVSWTGES